MLAKRIIPCLDVDKGRVVKGVRFVSLRDAGDPVEAAKAYNDAGADELVFLDIAASHEGRPILLDVVERTAAAVFMPLTVGGGIRLTRCQRVIEVLGGAGTAGSDDRNPYRLSHRPRQRDVIALFRPILIHAGQ